MINEYCKRLSQTLKKQGFDTARPEELWNELHVRDIGILQAKVVFALIHSIDLGEAHEAMRMSQVWSTEFREHEKTIDAFFNMLEDEVDSGEMD